MSAAEQLQRGLSCTANGAEAHDRRAAQSTGDPYSYVTAPKIPKPPGLSATAVADRPEE
jgi:hypothetical protein